MKIDLTGRTALVTGGTRGIGAAIAKRLHDSGARVLVTGTKQPTPKSGSTETLLVDFSDREGSENFALQMADRQIDILVNNAGVNKIALAGDVDMADWDRVQEINVRAPMLLARAIAPRMAERRWGRIVNLTSVFGHVSKSKRITYTTSKFALAGMTKALALDYATSNVLVNAVAPGFIDTELTRTVLSPSQIEEMVTQVPVGRLGLPEEIANYICFLVSDLNTFITGQNLLIDGGFTSG